MQEKRGARIQEHTRQDRNPREGDDIYRQVEPQSQTSQRNDDEHLQAEEQNNGCLIYIRMTEDQQIGHKKR